MMSRSVPDLVQIAHAGGGFRLDSAQFTVQQLTQIAHAAAMKGSRIVIHNVTQRTTQELVQIAHAGKGMVFYE